MTETFEHLLASQLLARARLSVPLLRELVACHGPDPVRILELREQLPPRPRERLLAAVGDPNEPDIAQRAASLGIRAVWLGDPEYPEALGPYDDAPALLFVRGGVLPRRPCVAVVGSRRPTSYGVEQADRFARRFAGNGFPIVSGGAAGIDAVAHQAALECGQPTVAILGCGPDIAYPASNRALFQKVIAAGGALASEFPPGTKPEPWHFPARNRIIAAWCIATLVVEAPEHSGALITARNAAEYGREVLVVPGPVDTGRSRGCHRLILDGATLVDHPDDAFACALGHGGTQAGHDSSPTAPDPRPLPANLSADEVLLFHSAGELLVPFEDLANRAGLRPEEAAVSATLLELKGLLRREPGNRWSRQPGWAA